jgi:adenylate cyclase
MVCGVLSYFGTVGYVAVVEGKEKRFIKSAFGMYVSPDVVAEIAERPDLLQLGGQKRQLSLLFSNLAGFTTLSERMDPQELNIGDMIMAFWNAPKDLPDHADRALRTMCCRSGKWASSTRAGEKTIPTIRTWLCA